MIRLLDIYEIEENFRLRINVELYFSWPDDRIIIGTTEKSSSVNVDFGFIKQIWIPDFYVYDLQDFRRLKVFQLPQGGLKMRKNVDNKTEVMLQTEAEISFTCPICYKSFPFHEAICNLRITSYNELNNSILFVKNVDATARKQDLQQEKIREVLTTNNN